MTTPHHPTCCSKDQLHDLLVGSVSDADSDAWLQHLEQCPTCQTKLHALAGEDGDWSQAREVLSASNDEKHAARSEEWAESLSRKLLSPPSHPEMLGRIGRYDIEWLLGSGGMGIVFKARQLRLGRVVALKTIRSDGLESAARRVRFRTEAEVIAAIEHPNIIRVHEIVETDETLWLSLEFCGGGSLATRLSVGPLPARAAVFTSLPDAVELPRSARPGWEAWFVGAAAAVLRATPDDGAAVFFQTDVKRDGRWIDKAFLVQLAARNVRFCQYDK